MVEPFAELAERNAEGADQAAELAEEYTERAEGFAGLAEQHAEWAERLAKLAERLAGFWLSAERKTALAEQYIKLMEVQTKLAVGYAELAKKKAKEAGVWIEWTEAIPELAEGFGELAGRSGSPYADVINSIGEFVAVISARRVEKKAEEAEKYIKLASEYVESAQRYAKSVQEFTGWDMGKIIEEAARAAAWRSTNTEVERRYTREVARLRERHLPVWDLEGKKINEAEFLAKLVQLHRESARLHTRLAELLTGY